MIVQYYYYCSWCVLLLRFLFSAVSVLENWSTTLLILQVLYTILRQHCTTSCDRMTFLADRKTGQVGLFESHNFSFL